MTLDDDYRRRELVDRFHPQPVWTEDGLILTDVGETHLSPLSAVQLFDEVKDEYVWNVQNISDSILSLQFGLPHLDVREPRPSSIRPDMSAKVARLYRRRLVTLHGQWNLFVEDGLWRVQADGLNCARHDTDLSKVELCLSS